MTCQKCESGGGGGCHLMQSIFTAYCDAWVCVCACMGVRRMGDWGMEFDRVGWFCMDKTICVGCCVTYLCEKIDSKFSKNIFFSNWSFFFSFVKDTPLPVQ